MLTRRKFQELQNTNNMLCLSCNKYYGIRRNYYLCSDCSNTESIGGEIKDNDFYEKYILSKKNFAIFSDNHFKMITQATKNLILINLVEAGVSSYGELVFFMIKAIRDIINEHKGGIYVHYMLSDEQSSKLISEIKWNNFNKGYLICHAIIRNKISPWSNYKNKLYDSSSYCYYGNYLELPTNKKHCNQIINYNLNSVFRRL